jgi:hypothetical protein
MASWKNSDPFCVVTRLMSQLSRGTTHWMLSGSAPDCRRLVQRDERVCVVPMATRLAVAVHDGDVRVTFGQQRVHEGQARSTAADDEVVGVHLLHGAPRL